MRTRTATAADYELIAAVIDDWWGRPVLGSLPRLFLDLFYRSSLIIDGDKGPDAFLVGILSPSDAVRAYIHFVGVSPAARGRGYGRLLYQEFFRLARADGRSLVSAITAVANRSSVDNYNGPERPMLVFERALSPTGAVS